MPHAYGGGCADHCPGAGLRAVGAPPGRVRVQGRWMTCAGVLCGATSPGVIWAAQADVAAGGEQAAGRRLRRKCPNRLYAPTTHLVCPAMTRLGTVVDSAG